MKYTNNPDITLFLNRAQNKIADLASLLVERGGDLPLDLILLLELSDFIESLDNKYNEWTEVDIIRWIHVFNVRANLNSIPFLLMTGFELNIIGGGAGFGLPITTADVSDFVPASIGLMTKFPHNNLALIQGGTLTERYHLTLAELNFLKGLMNVFIAPTVGLQLSALPDLVWQEKGTTVLYVNLLGSYAVNSGKSVLRYRYKRINRTPTDLLIETPGAIVVPYVHREPVKVNTVFRFEADFEDGGTKSADQTIKFIAPMWYGILSKGKLASEIQTLTKVVEGPINPRNFMYNLPSNNTTLPVTQAQVPYLLVSKSRGTLTRFEVETFDTLPDWKITTAYATLQDGTQEECWLCEFKNVVSGSYTFKVSWT